MNDTSLTKLAKTILSGSPNNDGATSYIIRNFFPESSIIQINKKRIEPCIDCKKCVNLKCLIKDDFESIIKESDSFFALITPIYFCGFPSYVKAFIDRFQYYWQNNIVLNFDYALIIMHGEKGNYKSEEGLKYLSEILFKILGAKKTFFSLLHKFNINDKIESERKILWLKKQMETAFFVK